MQDNVIDLPFDQQSIITELAFHEASHVVIGILCERLDVEFVPIQSFRIYPEWLDGNVNGLHSPHKTDEEHIYKPWYMEDERRYYGKIFATLAGFVSYKIFVNNIEFFISKPEKNWRNSNTIKYHSIESKEIFGNLVENIKGVPDFNGVQNRLAWKGINESVEKIQMVRRLMGDVQEILTIPALNEAVRFVADYLMRNPDREIEGAELDDIRARVNALTENESMQPWIEKYQRA